MKGGECGGRRERDDDGKQRLNGLHADHPELKFEERCVPRALWRRVFVSPFAYVFAVCCFDRHVGTHTMCSRRSWRSKAGSSRSIIC